jgi:hypothetical protein
VVYFSLNRTEPFLKVSVHAKAAENYLQKANSSIAEGRFLRPSPDREPHESQASRKIAPSRCCPAARRRPGPENAKINHRTSGNDSRGVCCASVATTYSTWCANAEDGIIEK